MEILQQLAVALGLSTLAGLNLYLTVFVTGLAINQQWIVLSSQYEALGVLGSPVIVIVAGILYFLEFFADKVPWVDSAWDAVHTAIRPIGAALISIQVLGDSSPAMDVIAGLMGGSVALTMHAAKATTRLLVNTSPEPFSNIAVSVTEDAAVIGGLWLLYTHPAISISLSVICVLATLWFLPKLWRATRVTLRLLFRKIKIPALENIVPLSEHRLPARLEAAAVNLDSRLTRIKWSAPVISRRGPSLPRNLVGWLASSEESGTQVFFVSNDGFRPTLRLVEVQSAQIRHETRFLLEEIHIFQHGTKKHFIFALDRSQRALAIETATALRQLAGPELNPENPSITESAHGAVPQPG